MNRSNKGEKGRQKNDIEINGKGKTGKFKI